jgi:hypothetical protein
MRFEMMFDDKDTPSEEEVCALVMRAVQKIRNGETRDYVYNQVGVIVGEWSLEASASTMRDRDEQSE